MHVLFGINILSLQVHGGFHRGEMGSKGGPDTEALIPLNT